MASSSCTSASGGKSNEYCLKWNHYQTSWTGGLVQLLGDKEYSMTDVTLACEGQFIQAHKLALVVSSVFFKEFFKMNRVEKAGITLIALANVKFKDLKNILQFIYHGEVNLRCDDLTSFLQTGKLLKIKGLDEFLQAEGTPTAQSNPNQAPTMFEYSTTTTNLNVTKKPPICSTSAASKSTSQSLCAPPIVLSTDQSPQLSTFGVQISSNAPAIESANTSMSSSSITTEFHNENDEIDEEMIDLDNVKPEPISVSLLADSEDSDYDEGRIIAAGEKTNEDDSNNYSSGPHSSSFVHSESLMGQLSTGHSGPSVSTLLPQFSHSSSHQRKARTADGEHGIGKEYYDNSENPKLLFLCLCGTKFRSKQSLNRHIKETKAAKMGTLNCPVCGTKFSRERSLKTHLRDGKSCRRVLGDGQTSGFL